ncbi:MAG: hypothetical protein Q8T08_00740 [Ignavibacteria bacterium]|nr:hypothetical protein [Ignavibacteria bacterium]
MTKREKNKIHLYFRYIIISLILSLAIFAIIFFLNINSLISSTGEKVINSNEYYSLRGKPTNLQKELFKELTTQVDKGLEDDLLVVELVARNFVADYYTWTNKQGPFDVGGGEYIFGNENLSFKRSSRRYFYSNIENYIHSGLNQEDLIEVETVTSLGAAYAGIFNYYGKDYAAYYVEVSWTYKESAIDTSIYPTFAAFTLVKNEAGRIEIVRFY